MPTDPGLLDFMVEMFGDASLPMMYRLLPMARSLFVVLLAIDLAWDLSVWSVSGRLSWHLWVEKILKASIAWTSLLLAPYWLPELIEGAGRLGELATGIPGLSPSALLGQGISLSLSMYDSLGEVLSMFIPGAGWLRAFLCIAILTSFALAAGQLTRILIEIALVLGGYCWLLAFAAWRPLSPVASNYLVHLIALSIKVTACYLLVGIGGDLGALWDQQLRELGALGALLEPGQAISMAAGAVVWGFLVLLLPDSLAKQYTAGLSFAWAEPTPSRP